MPFNRAAMKRRRRLLGISQADLSIMAGVTEATIGRMERGTFPNEGAHLGIDVFMRICGALQMEYRELLIPPSGNRYQEAVTFAKMAHHPSAAPKLHDQGESVKARNFRALTNVTAGADRSIIDREEPDEEPEHSESCDCDRCMYLRQDMAAAAASRPLRNEPQPPEYDYSSEHADALNPEARPTALQEAEAAIKGGARPVFDFIPDPSSE